MCFPKFNSLKLRHAKFQHVLRSVYLIKRDHLKAGLSLVIIFCTGTCIQVIITHRYFTCLNSVFPSEDNFVYAVLYTNLLPNPKLISKFNYTNVNEI